MKTLIAQTLVISATLAASQAATVLIDGSSRNGGFESNTASTYADMNNWFNNPGPQTTSIRSTLSRTGTYAAVVSLASNPTINTGHSITVGDAFDMGFYLRDNDSSGSPVVFWELFYFGNEGDGGFNEQTSTDRLVLFSGSATGTGSYVQTVNPTTTAIVADSEAIGSTLYLRFYRPAGDGQFPVIDDVTLSVIPEPSSALLGGLGLMALLRRRRA